MNYHTQNSDSVATVVTDVGRMLVNEKPPYNGASAFLEEEAGVYAGHHGGTGAVQKHGYGAQKAYPHGAEVGGYPLHAAAMNGRAAEAAYLNRYEHQFGGAGGHHGGGGALTQEYESDVSEEYEDDSDCSEEELASEEYEDDSDCSEEELAYGQRGTGGAQHYYEGYKQEGKHDTVVQKNGYGQLQHDGNVGGCDAIQHESSRTVQKTLAYGEQQVYHRHRGIDVGGHQNQTRYLGPQIWGQGHRRRKRWWWWWT